MKTFQIFEAQLWLEGSRLRSLAVMAADAGEALNIAQTRLCPPDQAIILIQHNPQIFFG